MRVFLDVSALAHLIYEGYEHHAAVSKLIAKVFGNATGCLLVNASSLNELYYLLRHNSRKEMRVGHSAAISIITSLLSHFDLVGTTEQVVQAALTSDEPDYEDAVVRAAAELSCSDVVITYDKKAFKNSSVPSMTAEEFFRFFFLAHEMAQYNL